jgi:hypothetical protein
MPHGSELNCKLGSVREEVLIQDYNLQISYPTDDIFVHANGIKSCFRQIKHHPNVAGAFSYILADHLLFQVGLAFGGKPSAESNLTSPNGSSLTHPWLQNTASCSTK